MDTWLVSSSGFLFKGSMLLRAGFDREVRECKAETPVGVDFAEVEASFV
jgi:hypothetical protein